MKNRNDLLDVDVMFWLAAFAAASLFLLRFGYDFGVSDQDEFLPWLAHLLDRSVLSNDWFVGIQDASFNVRTVFVRSLVPLAALVGAEAAVHIVYVLSLTGICLGIYRMGLALYCGHPVLAAAGVILAVAVTARWNPAGNDVAAAVLTPSMTAWAFALNAVATVLRDRLRTRTAITAAVLISIATAMQGLVGLQAAAVTMAIAVASDRSRRRPLVLFLALATGGALLTVIPVLAGSGLFDGGMFGAASDTLRESGSALTPVEILSRIRAPHHYLPSEFGPGRWARLWIIVAAGTALLWRRPDIAVDAPRSRMLLLIGIVLGALLIFRLWIALDPGGRVVLLQPFKMTVLLRVACAVAAVGWFHRLASAGKTAIAALALPTLFVTIGLYSGGLDAERLLPFTARSKSSVGDVHAWIAHRTPPDAVIAVPPGHTGFSWATQRAQFVNFKAVPYSDEDLTEWLRRLRTIAPFEPGAVGGSPLIDRLESRYHGLHPTQITAIMTAERINHVLARRGDSFSWPAADASYCNADWCVYSVDDLNAIDEWRYATD